MPADGPRAGLQKCVKPNKTFENESVKNPHGELMTPNRLFHIIILLLISYRRDINPSAHSPMSHRFLLLVD